MNGLGGWLDRFGWMNGWLVGWMDGYYLLLGGWLVFLLILLYRREGRKKKRNPNRVDVFMTEKRGDKINGFKI